MQSSNQTVQGISYILVCVCVCACVCGGMESCADINRQEYQEEASHAQMGEE